MQSMPWREAFTEAGRLGGALAVLSTRAEPADGEAVIATGGSISVVANAAPLPGKKVMIVDG